MIETYQDIWPKKVKIKRKWLSEVMLFYLDKDPRSVLGLRSQRK